MTSGPRENFASLNASHGREPPVRWPTEPLKYNSYIKGRIGWQNLRSDEFIDEGPFLVTGMHFLSGKVDWSSCYHISEERYDTAPEIQLRLDDVLITKDGTIGKLAYIDELPGPATLNSHLLVIRPLQGKYHPRFLYHVLASNDFKIYCDLHQSGTTLLGITQESIENFPLWLPPISEQTTIATFLDRETAKIDALIEEQKRLLELLKEKRQAIIFHAVTKGLDPTVKMKDSGIEWLGEVPEHWEVKQLRHFAEVLRGKFSHRPRNDPAFYDGPYPFVQTGDIRSASKFITDFKQTLNENGASVSKEFPRGTLVMAIAANIGDVAILDFPAYFPDSIVGLVPYDGTHLPYLFFLMQGMKQPMLQTATISTQLNLNVDQIVSLIAACPPIPEQQAIATHLDSEGEKIGRLVGASEQAVALLMERRSALISAAVTGKIDVRDLAETREAAE